MTTTFRVFGDELANQSLVANEASAFMDEIEAQGGQYVESHSAAVQHGTGTLFTLTVVYREASEPLEMDMP